jgi:histidyl-tRNA synthetase
MEDEGKLHVTRPHPTQVLVIPVDMEDYAQAINVVSVFRAQGIRTEIDVRNRSVRRNFDYANKLAIPYVAIIGSSERAAGTILLRNMQTGVETPLTLEYLAREISELSW